MFYHLYKTTNIVNGKFYIGIHQTEDLDDGYLGSGKLLMSAVKKYGRASFKKEILEEFESESAMISREIEVVTDEFCNRSDNYNVMPGGKFGSAQRNGLSFTGPHTDKTKTLLRLQQVGSKRSVETRLAISLNNFSKRDPEAQRAHASKAGIVGGTKPKSEKHRESLRIAAVEAGFGKMNKGLRRDKVECPHCHMMGSKNTMIRWHFDKCKSIALKSNGSDITL